jgi:hypothetical protein
MSGDIPPLPSTPSLRGAQLKHRDELHFTAFTGSPIRTEELHCWSRKSLFLWSPKIHHANLVHTSTSHFSRIQFNFIFLSIRSTPPPSKWSLTLRFFDQIVDTNLTVVFKVTRITFRERTTERVRYLIRCLTFLKQSARKIKWRVDVWVLRKPTDEEWENSWQLHDDIPPGTCLVATVSLFVFESAVQIQTEWIYWYDWGYLTDWTLLTWLIGLNWSDSSDWIYLTHGTGLALLIGLDLPDSWDWIGLTHRTGFAWLMGLDWPDSSDWTGLDWLAGWLAGLTDRPTPVSH